MLTPRDFSVEKAIQSVELVDLNEQTDSLKWIGPPGLQLLGLHFAHWVQGDADKSPSEAQSGRLISRPSFRPTLALEHPGLRHSRHDRRAAEPAAETAT